MLSGLQTIFLIRSLYVKPHSITLTNSTTFWWTVQTEWVILRPAKTNGLDLKAQNFENPIFTFACCPLKAVYFSCKLERLLLVTKFLFVYSFTPLLLSRHLSNEIVIFINACYQMKCFIGDSFSFFGSRFSWYSTYCFDFMWVHTRYSKAYSEQ